MPAWPAALVAAIQTGGTPGRADTPAPAEARIAAPVDSQAFAPALAAQVSLFARDGVHSAILQLNPAEMGPVTVRIALDGSSAQVAFQADRAGTRQAIEASLPALAGALQDAGLTLAGGGVFQQHPGHQTPREAQAPARTGAASSRTAQDSAPDRPGQRAKLRGLIDLVA